MKLTSLAVFATGYVIGTRAGHERYERIIDAMATASQRLEAFSSQRPPSRDDPGATHADRDPRPRRAPV